MPPVKVCLWNVQNYGSADGGPSAIKFGSNDELRNRFIATFIRQEKIDLLMMMEVAATAAPSLIDLLEKLNVGGVNDWAFSFCGSALERGYADPPEGPDEVAFQTDARSEGYAVLWRTGQANRFQMMKGLHGIDTGMSWMLRSPTRPFGNSPLNLTTKGRPILQTRKRDQEGVYTYEVAGGCGPNDSMPFDAQGNQVPWAELKFPTTGATNPRTLDMARARRPAYVVLKLMRPGGPQLCPVAVYHAPSRASKASWGVVQGGLSRELYATNPEGAAALEPDPDPNHIVHCANAVLGGDFNYDSPDWPGWYGNFVNALNRVPTGGAGCEVAPVRAVGNPAQSQTTVQLLEADHQTNRTGREIADYLSLSIDLVFFRAAAPSTGERVNLLAVLKADGEAGGPVYGGILKGTRAALHGVEQPPYLMAPLLGPRRQDGRKLVPAICGSWGGTFVDYPSFRQQLENGALLAPRQIAEYVHMFVSDHLPLTVSLEL